MEMRRVDNDILGRSSSFPHHPHPTTMHRASGSSSSSLHSSSYSVRGIGIGVVAGLILGYALGSNATLSFVLIGGGGGGDQDDATATTTTITTTRRGSSDGPTPPTSCAWHPSPDGCSYTSDYPRVWSDARWRHMYLYDSHAECCRSAQNKTEEDCGMVVTCDDDDYHGDGGGGGRNAVHRDRSSIPGGTSSTSPRTTAYSFVEDILPESLRYKYAMENLAFPITESMMRRSRPIIGNNQRLHGYLAKLHSGTCTTVLFLGGSVTRGRGAGGPGGSYPNFFVEWLNARYPCDGGGTHVAKRTRSGQNSQTCFALWNSIRDAGDAIDLVLMEFNVNDQL